MKRTEAREQAFRLLYSLQLIEEKDLEEQLELFFEENNIIYPYTDFDYLLDIKI